MRLKKVFLTIKNENKRIQGKKAEGSTLKAYEEWLSDNFYLVSDLNEKVTSFLNTVGSRKKKRNYENAFFLSRKILEELLWNITAERLTSALMSTQSELGENELAVFMDCVGYCILTALSETLSGSGEEKDNVAICIQSIRALLNLDRSKITEKVSAVETILLDDPANAYRFMDEGTKAYYRHVVSEIAEKTEKSEQEVAQLAVYMAKEAGTEDGRKGHVGYYLTDEGREALLCRVNGNIKLKKKMSASTRARWYSICLFVLAHLGSAEIFYLSRWLGAGVLWSLFVGMLAHIPIYVSVKISVDRILLMFLKQKRLLSMESSAVPEDACSFLVVPALLIAKNQTKELVQKLERLYFSGNPQNLYFAVLGDLKDSDAETCENDEELSKTAVHEIEKLNRRYGNRFFYFGRKRSLDTINRKYMGWERKRGAILEFIRLLHGEETTYQVLSSPLDGIPKVKYVICIDSDTELLKNSAQKLIAVMRHPLNAPEIDRGTGIVAKGYGLIQPSVQTSMEEAEKNDFSRIFSCGGGVDAYSFQNADFYQEFLGTAIFNGKGIFDVEAYYQVLNHAIAPQSVLSHDLLEGSFLRTGYERNVVVSDGHPKNLLSYVKRLHRWTRGDWQLLPYLFSAVRTENGSQKKNPLPYAAKYQIFDNMLRSLMFPSILILFLVGAAGKGSAGIAAFLGAVWQPLTVLVHGMVGGSFLRSMRSKPEREKMRRRLLNQAFYLCVAPYFAIKNADAAIRASIRTWITHKKMLEWVTAEEAEGGSAESIPDYYRTMAVQPVFAILILAIALLASKAQAWIAVIVAFAWLAAPLMAYYLGREARHRTELTEQNISFLEKLAKDTWKYFDRLATASEHYLPPDNFQEQPYQGSAHRTSPTNIGMLLCAYIAAYDFGWIDAKETLQRMNRTLSTVEQLEKKNGHLYNWYDTTSLLPLTPHFISTVDNGNFACMLVAVKQALFEIDAESELISRIEKLLDDMDFRPLFDKEKQQFSIGYDVQQEKLSNSCYDFLASEARQAVYYAIARNQASEKSWHRLSRKMTKTKEGEALLSWTGTMFEYLMPTLFMPSHAHSLFFESYQNVVKEQIHYAKRFGLPVWGISESGFCSFDRELNYQYKALGVPALALKRDMHYDLVISPYSSCLALGIDTQSAVENMKEICRMGARGQYGMYEAIDFTNGHIGKEKPFRIVKSYMAHHQGMSLLALDNLLHQNIFCKRFMRDTQMQTAKYLLDEPKRRITDFFIGDKVKRSPQREDDACEVPFEYQTERTDSEQAFFALSNGTAHMLMGCDGIGCFYRNDIQLYRFRALYPGIENGHFVFVKLQELPEWESLTYAPGFSQASCEMKFAQGAFHFNRRFDSVDCEMKVSIGNQDAAEIREIIFSNYGGQKQLEIMNYMEPVLARETDDHAHPAFSGLFLQTEYDSKNHILFAKRRARGSEDKELYAAIGISGGSEISVETSRMNWIGRGNDICSADAFSCGELSNTTGSVLDAIFSFRAVLHMGEKETKRIRFVSAMAESKEAAQEICMKYQAADFCDNAKIIFERMQEEMRFLKLDRYEADLIYKLLTMLVHAKAFKEQKKTMVADGTKGQEGLWKLGISGDHPILLYHIYKEGTDLQWIVKALLFLRSFHICLDCVVFQKASGEYYNSEMRMLDEILAKYGAAHLKNTHGGIYLFDEAVLEDGDMILLQTAAFAECTDERPISEQLCFEKRIPAGKSRKAKIQTLPHPSETENDLLFFNGYGGFQNGEYVIKLTEGRETPLPWSHIVSNEHFGFLVTERGGGYLWYDNARECKLTPWSNDAVTDPLSEVFWVCDKEQNWYSPMKGVMDDGGEYIIRYGKGFCEFSHSADGIFMQVMQSVDLKQPVKLSAFTLENTSDTEQEYFVYYALKPLLGVSDTEKSIVTRQENGRLYAKNLYRSEYADRLLFVASSHQVESYTGDGREFFDSRANVILPQSGQLNGKTGFLPSSCLGIRVKLSLKAKEKQKVIFYAGCTGSNDALQLPEYQMNALHEYWDGITGGIRIKTPDASLDTLVNGFLLYQTLACRMYARTAFYQCGGAYGFRDQLQDSLAFLYTQPEIVRRQILYHAARQFEEGDVLHWWHEGENGEIRGVRTRISDDLLWLCYAVWEYIEVTGDDSLLEEEIPYLSGEPLNENESERYFTANQSCNAESLYMHMRRVFYHSMTCGSHGLPLIGIGDWNDGMNEVGKGGRGESVWLGWFLVLLLKRWLPIAEKRKDTDFAKEMKEYCDALTLRLNRDAWDGEWFLRAFYDDGSPLGGAAAKECQIDLIAQSWAVISGGAEKEKCEMALRAVRKYLIDEEHQLIRLLYPPFESANPSPGYIQGYPKGIRENGGQYTHGAMWAVIAFAQMGKTGEAYHLLSMLNPIHHTRTMQEAQIYGAEPYAVSADIYTAPGHEGRAGWSWYTGAAGWMYRVAVEEILGMKKTGNIVWFEPKIGIDWEGFRLEYRYGSSLYRFVLKAVSGKQVTAKTQLEDDGKIHEIFLEYGIENGI